jgi:hypothetical protein
MAVHLVGAGRIDVLAVGAVRRDPFWIETTVSLRADDERAVRDGLQGRPYFPVSTGDQ